MSRTIARIAVSAVPFTVDRPFDYVIPEQLSGQAVPGVRVMVPFGRGNSRREGVILSVQEESRRETLKCVESVLDTEPVLSQEHLKLALWMRDRCFCTVYDAVRAMLPAGMWFKNGVRKTTDKIVDMVELLIPAEEAYTAAQQKRMRAPQQAALLEAAAVAGVCSAGELRYFTGASMQSLRALEKQGFVSIYPVEAYRRPEVGAVAPAEPISLSGEQQQAYDGLRRLMDTGRPEAALLFGVTGSGKTSVYLKLIYEVLSRGKGALVLVPEIALTPQYVRLFTAHFGDSVAVLHSSLSAGERLDEWKRIRAGAARVVIGTRSAVFAPVQELGLLVIDEEQEHTYKSENPPRYHARDIAKYRCVQKNALLLLGSATPSVESMYSAKQEKYHLFQLTHRFNDQTLPQVLIADLRQELKNGNGSSISRPLQQELEKNIAAGEQTILFINRRGASSQVVCGACGYTYTCPNCSVSMTSHSANRRLMCHYCGHSIPAPDFCPECGGELKFIGVGTQKVEEELHVLFPETEILRMDTDTVSAAGSHEKILDRFRDEKVPILVGTQMVAKGLDFENVTLVGVISADQSLYASDFRAHERTFSLLTQVVGRSGRGQKSGRAVIQTFTPMNEVIQLAAAQDYIGFYEREIQLRAILCAPPVSDLFSVTVSGQGEAAVLHACVKLKDAFEHYLGSEPGMRVLGPAPLPVYKVNGRYRYSVTISCTASKYVRDTVCHVLRQLAADKTCRGVTAYADMNPQT